MLVMSAWDKQKRKEEVIKKLEKAIEEDKEDHRKFMFKLRNWLENFNKWFIEHKKKTFKLIEEVEELERKYGNL